MKSRVIAIKENKLTFYALCAGIILSFGLYVYSLNATVLNGVSHNKSESYLSDLTNKVSDMEAKYAEKRGSLSMESARTFGLVELQNKVFISKNTEKSLSFLNAPRELR
jgi:hypothetical protein